MVYCTLRKYLGELEALEGSKVNGKHVPSMLEIGKDAGLSYRTVTRIANNHTLRLDYRTANKIINAVRKHGHDMRIHHMIDFMPDEEVAESED